MQTELQNEKKQQQNIQIENDSAKAAFTKNRDKIRPGKVEQNPIAPLFRSHRTYKNMAFQCCPSATYCLITLLYFFFIFFLFLVFLFCCSWLFSVHTLTGPRTEALRLDGGTTMALRSCCCALGRFSLFYSVFLFFLF